MASKSLYMVLSEWNWSGGSAFGDYIDGNDVQFVHATSYEQAVKAALEEFSQDGFHDEDTDMRLEVIKVPVIKKYYAEREGWKLREIT